VKVVVYVKNLSSREKARSLTFASPSAVALETFIAAKCPPPSIDWNLLSTLILSSRAIFAEYGTSGTSV